MTVEKYCFLIRWFFSNRQTKTKKKLSFWPRNFLRCSLATVYHGRVALWTWKVIQATRRWSIIPQSRRTLNHEVIVGKASLWPRYRHPLTARRFRTRQTRQERISEHQSSVEDFWILRNLSRGTDACIQQAKRCHFFFSAAWNDVRSWQQLDNQHAGDFSGMMLMLQWSRHHRRSKLQATMQKLEF